MLISGGKQERTIARWVAPTLRVLASKKRKYADKLATQHIKRSGFAEWNFDAEVYSFDKRLNENFDLKLLSQAFYQRSYVIQEELRLEKTGADVIDTNMVDNRELAEKGQEFAVAYVQAFLKYHLPRLPNDGIAAIQNHLLSIKMMAHISSNLGTKELIFAEEYPPSEETLATTLFAIIGALKDSQPNGYPTRPCNFVRDFICTHLNQLDLNEHWQIEKPYELLQSICSADGIASIEPRILGQMSRSDILYCVRIGIYDSSSKKLLGSSYGENYDGAIEAASVDALNTYFGISNLKPFDYTIAPEKLFDQAKKLRLTN